MFEESKDESAVRDDFKYALELAAQKSTDEHVRAFFVKCLADENLDAFHELFKSEWNLSKRESPGFLDHYRTSNGAVQVMNGQYEGFSRRVPQIRYYFQEDETKNKPKEFM